MWQILHASFWKFSKLLNSGISLNWCVTDEVIIRNTTAYFLAQSVYLSVCTCVQRSTVVCVVHNRPAKTSATHLKVSVRMVCVFLRQMAHFAASVSRDTRLPASPTTVKVSLSVSMPWLTSPV